MRKLESWFVAVNKLLAGLLVLATFIIVLTNVVLRYGWGASLPWAEEVARMLMVATVFIASGLALRDGRLVAIEMFHHWLPRPALILVRGAVVMVMICFMALLVWYGVQFTQFGAGRETMATQISRAIPYASIPIGATLFCIHASLFAKRYVFSEFGDVSTRGADISSEKEVR